ncbi:nucleotidyl transferase AbiEii/AbiGii toxin family protein [Dactylosporangium sp. NPDC050588]|uniref:nucleotidyl transferase AbiEii/AbiGii toxin family protein n=1 Tax=Dactylosporangium sp. NPDC050588 TaxID=3157211 RepID=UPI0033C6992D
MHDNAPAHRRLAEIGLRAGGPHGFALAGGHAVAAHGILQRPSEDVDLFADWQRRADFPAAVEVVIAAYMAAGYEVEIDHRTETFARLYLTDPAERSEHHRVELVANWRLQPPVQMDIGPVLHADDVMAGKVDALYNRAAARDFLDIDAAIGAGRYTLERLCQLAEAVDLGFDRSIFEQMLRSIRRFDDEDFAEYGVSSEQVAALRLRVDEWRAQLVANDDAGPLAGH